MVIEADITETGKVLSVTLDGEKGRLYNPAMATRQVFIFKDYLVKFDMSFCDEHFVESVECCQQNEKELALLEEIEPKDKKYFCLPVQTGEIEGFSYIIQKKLRGKDFSTPQTEKILEEITEKYGLKDVWVREGLPINFIFTKTGIKIYDYGV